MHTLSDALLAAQRNVVSIPFVRATLAERWGGVAQLRWERVAGGNQPDGPHDTVITSGGALVRVRAQSHPNGLFVQRVAAPGPDARFDVWRNLGTTSPASGVTVTEINGQIHLFDVAANGTTVRERISRDDGVTFGSPAAIVTAPDTVTHLTAASGPSGSALLLYADPQGVIYSATRTAGAWSSAAAWTNSLASVGGVAGDYMDGDWAIVVCGTLPDASSGVWTCVRGAGSSTSAGAWSTLHEVIGATPGADVTFAEPGLCVADGPRISFVEAYGGASGYTQTMLTHAPASARFRDHRWREASPFSQAGGCGAALTADASFAWLTTSSGVWRARINAASMDVSDFILSADARETPRAGSITLLLAEGAGLAPSVTDGSGPLGQELSIAWGYATDAGQETGQPQRYWVREVRRETRRGAPVTVLEAEDAWWFMSTMRARRQLTWPAHTASVWTILGQLLTMAGLSATLDRSSPSIVATYPPMTISPNEALAPVINRLMSRVPDVLRFSDGVLEAIHARETDSAVYSYGGPGEHPLLTTARSSALARVNHVQVYGSGAIGQAIDEQAVSSVGNLLLQVVDHSLTTVEVAATRAEAELRSRSVLRPSASITVPVNVGQQLHDVVSITAPSVGLEAELLRVAGLRTRYDVSGAQTVYRQDIDLGGV